MKKKKIYVAYTGGTIGMCPSPSGYVPLTGHLQNTLANMPEFHRDEMPAFSLHEYAPLMDSSDMSPEDWNQVARDIQQHYDEFDGFVILHGTDTMAYTASALSFMLQGLNKPVIVTGSQIPLSELRSDGQVNLLNALYLAANYPLPEVTLYFNNKLMRGNRATKSDADGFDAFSSPNFSTLIDVGIEIKVNNAIPQYTPSEETLSVQPITPQPIGMVRLYPGIMPELVHNILRQPVRALLLHSYGVGNAPNNPKLLHALHQASEDGIIIVNCSQCVKGRVNMNGYATGHRLLEMGAISGADMTTEATLTKLHYLLSQQCATETIKTMMQTDLCGELTTL